MAGALLGREALRQIEEVCRKVLRGFQNDTPRTGRAVFQDDTIEFVLGEAVGASTDPLDYDSLEYARVYVYGRDRNGDAVYLRQQYVYNPFTGVTGEAYQYGNAKFINGYWLIQTLDCNPIAGYAAPEALDELLPDKPSGA